MQDRPQHCVTGLKQTSAHKQVAVKRAWLVVWRVGWAELVPSPYVVAAASLLPDSSMCVCVCVCMSDRCMCAYLSIVCVFLQMCEVYLCVHSSRYMCEDMCVQTSICMCLDVGGVYV